MKDFIKEFKFPILLVVSLFSILFLYVLYMDNYTSKSLENCLAWSRMKSTPIVVMTGSVGVVLNTGSKEERRRRYCFKKFPKEAQEAQEQGLIK